MEQVDKKDDDSKKRKSRFPRERLLRKIQANKERQQQIYEMRVNSYLQKKNISQPMMENPQQKEPTLAEKIIQKKIMAETRHEQLRSEIYNHINDLELKVDFLLQQLIGKESNEPYVDPEIWMMFTSEQFQQEIDTFLDCQIEDINHENIKLK